MRQREFRKVSWPLMAAAKMLSETPFCGRFRVSIDPPKLPPQARPQTLQPAPDPSHFQLQVFGLFGSLEPRRRRAWRLVDREPVAAIGAPCPRSAERGAVPLVGELNRSTPPGGTSGKVRRFDYSLLLEAPLRRSEKGSAGLIPSRERSSSQKPERGVRQGSRMMRRVHLPEMNLGRPGRQEHSRVEHPPRIAPKALLCEALRACLRPGGLELVTAA